MAETSIEWTQMSWSPVVGCTRVSAGCDHCYAVLMTRRLAAMGQAKYAGLVNRGKGHFNGTVRLHEPSLDLPLRWRKPRRIFVNPMSDLFHEGVPEEAIDQVFAVMALTPRHTYQVLTKRPERMLSYLRQVEDERDMQRWESAAREMGRTMVFEGDWVGPEWPPRNIWLLVSVENQATADERIPPLLQTPAAVRGVSVEPLLGPVDLESIPQPIDWPTPGIAWCEFRDIDWVICGGESGPGARPMKPSWARDLRDQCQAAGVPFFFKQWGGWNKKQAGRLLDGRTWDEIPGLVGTEGEKSKLGHGGWPMRSVPNSATPGEPVRRPDP